MSRVRLDTLLHDRGLVDSRSRGQALILAGLVRVDGQTATKAGTRVPTDANAHSVPTQSHGNRSATYPHCYFTAANAHCDCSASGCYART